jgi:hypothetical protein
MSIVFSKARSPENYRCRCRQTFGFSSRTAIDLTVPQTLLVSADEVIE